MHNVQCTNISDQSVCNSTHEKIQIWCWLHFTLRFVLLYNWYIYIIENKRKLTMHLLSLSDTLNFCINWLFFLQNTCLRGTSWIDDVIWPHWQYPGFEIEFKHQVFIKLEEPLSQPMKRYKSFAIKFCMFLSFQSK